MKIWILFHAHAATEGFVASRDLITDFHVTFYSQLLNSTNSVRLCSLKLHQDNFTAHLFTVQAQRPINNNHITSILLMHMLILVHTYTCTQTHMHKWSVHALYIHGHTNTQTHTHTQGADRHFMAAALSDDGSRLPQCSGAERCVQTCMPEDSHTHMHYDGDECCLILWSGCPKWEGQTLFSGLSLTRQRFSLMVSHKVAACFYMQNRIES